MHEVDDGLQVTLPTAQVRLAHFVFALSSGSPAHLASTITSEAYLMRAAACYTYNIAGPTRSQPIRAL